MLKGHFIDSVKGKLFVTQIGELNTNTAIVCLPSITEELNLARAVVAKQSQAFAEKGLPCFVVDYYGTGDSEGEFEQATAETWLTDVENVCHWLKSKGITQFIFWGVRFGALLLLSHQEKLHQQFTIKAQIYWKPVTNGKLFVGQFLRIKQASEMINETGVKTNWRQHILDGNDTEVAGYSLNKAMLTSIEDLAIKADFVPMSPVTWFELAAKEITPATKRIIQAIEPSMLSVKAFECPPFWQVPEVFGLPELNQLNLQSLALDSENE